MLKFFFWLLLLANGALLAYQQGYLDTWFADNHEPGRLAKQLNADKIRLLPANTGKPAVADTGKKALADAADIDTLPAVAADASKNQDATVVPACTEFGNFSDAEAKRFEAQLTPLALGKRLSRRTLTEGGSHMVFIPPQGNKENAEKKIGELRRMGITDFYLVQDNSPMRWSISLGIF
ncbi:MAG: SPOR domain-containing protein, partial [Proteobacteria bacterium]|nr:SPOR domain-containing protein [Pseudomonadota bacterium]